ncbi:SAM-dependent methyltransferase [Streptomyces sp. NPDC048272]|uniref:SAM-dependent methyltransferase n=1 Tax=Streptomyces sp. NPDC048272 TaxID=3154616 RepID=UPI00344AE6A0
MERPAWAPPGIDISVPSVSRIYDYYLGGSHNFEVDRQAARRAMEFLPGLPKIMQANRAFMRRAVRHAVAEGVTQFLDIGSGIPTFGNVHEIARAASPEARVVYVDHDPVAVAHSQAVLAGDELTGVVTADLRKPQEILTSPEVARLIDFERPVALLLVAVLHFIEDSDDPYTAVAQLRDALAPGSLLILTHASYEGIPLSQEIAGGAVGVYRDIRNPLVMRDHQEISRLFDGFEWVEPGLVSMPDWRPDRADAPADGDTPEDPYAFSGFGGVGRKA